MILQVGGVPFQPPVAVHVNVSVCDSVYPGLQLNVALEPYVVALPVKETEPWLGASIRAHSEIQIELQVHKSLR